MFLFTLQFLNEKAEAQNMVSRLSKVTQEVELGYLLKSDVKNHVHKHFANDQQTLPCGFPVVFAKKQKPSFLASFPIHRDIVGLGQRGAL